MKFDINSVKITTKKFFKALCGHFYMGCIKPRRHVREN